MKSIWCLTCLPGEIHFVFLVLPQTTSNYQISEVTERNPWFGELWNIRFLKDTSWNDLFGAEREEEEQRRAAHDRDIVVAKHQSRQFSAALDTKKLEKRMKIVKGKRFNERKPLDLNKRQKLTEEEIKEKLARSNRTPPDGCLGFSAVSNTEFMNSLFAGGL
uniref:Pre-mRNA-splicing factor SYF2 n=1 Tax=Trichobilharzia regenti TaxID=157069 RepID=A0AA85KMF6_TRIRE|nr:unnamed protein product [Trichobilharzia regenti]